MTGTEDENDDPHSREQNMKQASKQASSNFIKRQTSTPGLSRSDTYETAFPNVHAYQSYKESFFSKELAYRNPEKARDRRGFPSLHQMSASNQMTTT